MSIKSLISFLFTSFPYQSYPHGEDVMMSQNTTSNVIGQKYFLSRDFIGQFIVK
jgi:hypothetical protein